MNDNMRNNIQNMLFTMAAKSKNDITISSYCDKILNKPIIVAYPINNDSEFKFGFVLFKVINVEPIFYAKITYVSRMYIPHKKIEYKNNLSWNTESIYMRDNGYLQCNFFYESANKIFILNKKALLLYNKLERYFLLNNKIMFESL